MSAVLHLNNKVAKREQKVNQNNETLPFFSEAKYLGIQPAELRRKEATLSLALRAMEPGHLLHSALISLSSGKARRLKPRHPFVSAAQQLIISSDNKNRIAALWADHQ